jgi:hypothetical protein
MTNTQQPQALAAAPLSDIHGPLAGTVADFAPISASFAIPEGLHPNTATLVRDFAEAMAKKLRASEVKYGWTANWMRKGWQGELAAELLRHVHKGDPIDVAAYCAFAWFHGWSVAPAEASATSGGKGWRYFNDDRVRLSDGTFGIVTGRGRDGLLRIRPETKPDWTIGDLTSASDDDLDAWRGAPAPLEFGYTNWRGEFGQRRVQPLRLYFGSTEWHPEPQWLLEAMDSDKGEVRSFAFRDIAPTPQPAGMGFLAERLREMDAYLAEGFIACPRCSEQIITSDMDVRSDIAELIDALTGLPSGHVVIEQSETLDLRIAQTIQRPDGTDYVRILPSGNDARHSALIYPADATAALIEALGIPNFKASPIAHALRAAGADIPRKSEAEQAHVLHWFVKLALQHGDGWWKVAGDEIGRIALAARQKAGEGSANG